MSVKIYCDGCEQPIQDIVIGGYRADGQTGVYPLPDEGFDWCGRCADIAFKAVTTQGRKAAFTPPTVYP